MTDTSAWFVLVGALGGVALTGAFSLTTAILNHRWTDQVSKRSGHEQELRTNAERLRDVFRDYLVATNAYYHAIHQMHLLGRSRSDGFDTWLRPEYSALQGKYQYLTISAGRDVRELARAYDMVLYRLRDVATDFDEEKWSELQPETHKSRERVRVAMRAELGIHD